VEPVDSSVSRARVKVEHHISTKDYIKFAENVIPANVSKIKASEAHHRAKPFID
jgi:hypothetical protein